MKKLEDIVLHKGDMVEYNDGTILFVDSSHGNRAKIFQSEDYKIKSIKRPLQYKTIYEAPHEILDKEEKEYLEEFIKVWELEDRLKSFIKIEVSSKICGIRQYVRAILKDDEKVMAVVPFDVDKHYKGMELDKEYTLKELGLFK